MTVNVPSIMRCTIVCYLRFLAKNVFHINRPTMINRTMPIVNVKPSTRSSGVPDIAPNWPFFMLPLLVGMFVSLPG